MVHYYVNVYVNNLSQNKSYLKIFSKIDVLIMFKNTGYTTIFFSNVSVSTPKKAHSLKWTKLKLGLKEEKIMSSKGQSLHIIIIVEGNKNYNCLCI